MHSTFELQPHSSPLASFQFTTFFLIILKSLTGKQFPLLKRYTPAPKVTAYTILALLRMSAVCPVPYLILNGSLHACLYIFPGNHQPIWPTFTSGPHAISTVSLPLLSQCFIMHVVSAFSKFYFWAAFA